MSASTCDFTVETIQNVLGKGCESRVKKEKSKNIPSSMPRLFLSHGAAAV